MRNFSNLSKIVFLAVILLTACTEVFAPPQQFNTPAQSQRKVQTPQEKRQQLEQEAPNAMTAVETAYKEILSYVNSAQSPSEADIKNFLKTVAINRKYIPLKVVSDVQKSTYHIFSSWVYYFDNKQDRAMKEAASGQKAAPNNQNTVKTRLALSLLYKDYTSASEALTVQNIDNRPARPPGSAGSESQSYQQPTDDIKLDVNAIRIEPLGKIFGLHPEPVEANSAPWRPAGKLTCALLWTIDTNELDHFAPVEKKAKSAREANEPNLPIKPEPQPYGQQQAPVWQQPHELGEFSQLQGLFGKDKRAAFAAINLNNPEKRKNLVNWLGKNHQTFRTFQLSADQQQKTASIIGETNNPMLLIAAPDSTIRYVGDANGFLPQMIIRNILQNPLEFASSDLNEPNLSSAVISHPNQPVVESAQPVESPVEPNTTSQSLTADINKTDVNTPKPKKDSNDVNTASAPVAPVMQKADDGFSAADDYQAEEWLSYARTYLQIGNKTPSHLYKDPIEWCRKVMKNYPNTKYAQEAQMLLRNVPKEHREQYKITDQELGL
ncbi:MAG: hypothetical protein ABSE89_06870 [Sedimentisphaerales bacterium]